MGPRGDGPVDVDFAADIGAAGLAWPLVVLGDLGTGVGGAVPDED